MSVLVVFHVSEMCQDQDVVEHFYYKYPLVFDLATVSFTRL